SIGLDMTVVSHGVWQLRLQKKASGANAVIKMPMGGLTGTTSGFANCTFTSAPDAPEFLQGTFVNGSPSQIVLDSVPIAANVTGASPCPSGNATGTVSVTFSVIDMTDSGSAITVS